MTQRTWFITGITSGFGRHMAELLLGRGDRVAGTARKLEQLSNLQAQYPDRLWLTRLDLIHTADIRPAVDAALPPIGPIEVVLNNAPSTSSAPRSRTFAPGAAAASCRSPPLAANMLFPPSALTTPPNGA